MRYRIIVVHAVLLTISIIMAGCFSAKPEDLQAFLKPDQADVTLDTYIFQPPDVITVISSKVPELEGTTTTVGLTQTIRPDGKISFENVGEIMVAGKTPGQVAKIIGDKMAALYQLPGDYPVDVRVSNQSKLYYVVGEVINPGAQIFTGRETTLSAIARAVITVQAWEERIQVIRPAANAQQRIKVFALNLKDMMEKGDMSKNVLLKEGDIIYVPPTILASIGRTIEELVGPILGGAGATRAMSPSGQI